MQEKYIDNTLRWLLYSKYSAIIFSRMRYTVRDFRQDFPDDNVCLDTIFKERFGDVDTCPSCGVIGTKFYRVKGRKCYSCEWCGYQLHPLAGTIFHKSSTPLTLWFYAIYLFSVSKNGVAAKELERHLGVTYKTAHRMARQIRSLMAQNTPIGGNIVVEADETYIGGRGRSWERMVKKKPVLGIVERGGEIRVKVSDTASTRRVTEFFSENLIPGTELHTDESPLYKWTKTRHPHRFIKHKNKQYAYRGVTTNTIEGFWGQLKRSISGTYHAVSPKYLQLYVDEFAFRYSYRDVVVYPVLLERAATRVELKS